MISALAHEEASSLYAETVDRAFLSRCCSRRTDRWLIWVSPFARTARTGTSMVSQPRPRRAGSARIDRSRRASVRALAADRPDPDGLAEILLGTVADTTGATRVLLLTGEGEQPTVRAVWEHGATTTVEGPWAEVGHDHALVVARGE